MSWIEQHPDIYESYDLSRLQIDQALVNFIVNASLPLWIYEVSSNCLTCPLEISPSTLPDDLVEDVRVVATKFPYKYRLRTRGEEVQVPEHGDSYTFCDIEYKFGEFGVYEVKVEGNITHPICQLVVALEPVNIYLPIVLVTLFFMFVEILVWGFRNYERILPESLCKYLSQYWNQKGASALSQEDAGGRLISLDVFRGVCIVLMILVHDGSASYSFLEHATWDGLQVADLLFPWFLWIMGVCIPISLKSQSKKSVPVFKLVKRICIRSLKLFIVGIILGTIGSSATDIGSIRFFGVLQRFAVTNLVCGLLAVWCLHGRYQSQNGVCYHRNSNAGYPIMGRFYEPLKDIVLLWKGWLVAVVLVIVHLVVTFLLPVPGCPTGYLGPGGLHDNAKHPVDCVGGAAGYVDRKIWGSSHLFQWPTVNEVYNHGDGGPYDPEGTLGFLTSSFQVWSGVQFGVTLIEFSNWISVLPRLGMWAGIQGLLAGFLCNWRQTGGVIPINKNLWSLSFVFVTNFFALLLIGSLYVVIDLMKWWSGTPLAEAGMNSILLYVAHLVAQKMFPWHWSFGNMSSHFAQLVESVWGISLWVLLAIWLHKQKRYIKI